MTRASLRRRAVWTLAILAALVGAALILGFLGPLWFPLDAVGYFRPHFATLLLLAAVGLALLRARMAAVAVALISGVGLAGMGPAWRSVERPPAGACESPAIRVATANVLFDNPTHVAAAEAVMAVDADILVTQETEVTFFRAARRQAGPTRFLVYHRGKRHNILGTAIWSRFPIRERAYLRDAARAVVELEDGRRIGVIGTHVARPIIDRQDAQIAEIARIAAPLPEIRLVMGDFNAASWSEAMARVEAGTNTEVIGGLRKTWRGAFPSLFGAPKIPSVIGHQIDHILLSEGWGVDAVETFDIPGSDHLGVVATVRPPCPIG